MKQLIKRVAGAILTARVSEIARRVDDFDVISFDVYDTLVRRRVPSLSDVLEVMSAEPLERCFDCTWPADYQ